ncbi:hypothetical protein MKW98_011472 [Papaver atlanticum]|uniref:Uncharacterized protein n=1 Tax=Papaver atlanticum TaxID=357466 RepID=A0AAD4RXD0_9MAGN|nr:hypothetical protein MKW98_011472 [Papaver atlanticum]
MADQLCRNKIINPFSYVGTSTSSFMKCCFLWLQISSKGIFFSIFQENREDIREDRWKLLHLEKYHGYCLYLQQLQQAYSLMHAVITDCLDISYVIVRCG